MPEFCVWVITPKIFAIYSQNFLDKPYCRRHIDFILPMCACVCLFFSLCVPELCAAHNFVMRGGIRKLFGTYDHHDKTMCHVQESFQRSRSLYA